MRNYIPVACFATCIPFLKLPNRHPTLNYKHPISTAIRCANSPTPSNNNPNHDHQEPQKDTTNLATRLKQLKILLETAVSKENYLEAAQHRDEIGKLEKEQETTRKKQQDALNLDGSQHDNHQEVLETFHDTGLDDLDKAEEEVRIAHDAFCQAFASADSEAMSKIWLDMSFVTCALPLPPNSNKKGKQDVGGALAVGHEDVIRAWQQLWMRGVPTTVQVSDVRIVLLGRSGIAYGVSTVDVDAVRGRMLIGGKRIVTNVFARRMGKWWVVHYQASPVAVQSG